MRTKVQVHLWDVFKAIFCITISRMTNAFACVRMRVEVRRSARVVFSGLCVSFLVSSERVCSLQCQLEQVNVWMRTLATLWNRMQPRYCGMGEISRTIGGKEWWENGSRCVYQSAREICGRRPTVFSCRSIHWSCKWYQNKSYQASKQIVSSYHVNRVTCLTSISEAAS